MSQSECEFILSSHRLFAVRYQMKHTLVVKTRVGTASLRGGEYFTGDQLLLRLQKRALNTTFSSTRRIHESEASYEPALSVLVFPLCLSDVSLGLLAQRFLDLLQNTPDGALDLRDVTTSLNTRRRRVYDITNVLEGISLLERQSANKFKWM